MLDRMPTTIPAEPRDYPEWHRGRKWYSVWVLRCDGDEAVRAKWLAARRHLQDCLLEPCPRQPHITLFVCGFLVSAAQFDDDFPLTRLAVQIQALEGAGIRPFEIEIGGMNSFVSAPFLEVCDPDEGILRLRQAISQGANEFRTAPYRPHLTIGLYSGVFPSEAIRARMAAFATRPVRWRVARVTFAVYRAETLTGRLSYRYDVGL